MSDFFQNGIVTTLPDLGGRPTRDLERELSNHAERHPITLVLPCLYSELQGPALDGIVKVLAGVPYLSRIVIGLDRADEAAFRHALGYFSRLPQPHQVIWNDGPRVQGLLESLGGLGLAPMRRGKGSNLWLCLGMVQAAGWGEVIATHDCDIVNYDARLLARLIYPVAHPATGYVFAKGYYPRISDGMLYGRVTRLFVTPLLRALRRLVAPNRYLDYLDSFRYPLAGECAFRADAVRRLHLSLDWGLEIGVLTEIYRDHSTRQICQVAIADRYDHKHQALATDARDAGLAGMSREIAVSVLRGLAAQGVVMDMGQVRTVVTAYQRIVLDLMDSYADLADINGLVIDRGAEAAAAEVFARSLFEAGRSFVQENTYSPMTPTWDEVLRREPDALTALAAAVAADRRDFGLFDPGSGDT